jgi:hypothetical protein
MSVLTIPNPWGRIVKLICYSLFGIGCAYCVSACSLNFGA